MQIIEIPKAKATEGCYEKPDKSVVSLVVAEDDVKVATLLTITKSTLKNYLTEYGLVSVNEGKTAKKDYHN